MPVTIFELSSMDSSDRLVVQVVNRRECDVMLTAVGLSAKERVYDALSFEGFPEFFAALASSWKGWEGEQRWESMEGNFRIRASSDRTGHVRFMVRLEYMAPYHWAAELAINVEAGQLESIARAAGPLRSAFATAG
jgi:uncharacterized protein DUF6228